MGLAQMFWGRSRAVLFSGGGMFLGQCRSISSVTLQSGVLW